jgi:hypothetical protein
MGRDQGEDAAGPGGFAGMLAGVAEAVDAVGSARSWSLSDAELRAAVADWAAVVARTQAVWLSGSHRVARARRWWPHMPWTRRPMPARVGGGARSR